MCVRRLVRRRVKWPRWVRELSRDTPRAEYLPFQRVSWLCRVPMLKIDIFGPACVVSVHGDEVLLPSRDRQVCSAPQLGHVLIRCSLRALCRRLVLTARLCFHMTVKCWESGRFPCSGGLVAPRPASTCVAFVGRSRLHSRVVIGCVVMRRMRALEESSFPKVRQGFGCRRCCCRGIHGR